jgi:sensor histidine kinase YesM
MILQPLAENAIVHGIAPVTGPGELRIRAERRDDGLVLEISDSGPGFGTVARLTACRAHQEDQTGDDGRSSTGIGLANTRARIAQLYGERSVLWVGAGDTGGACVSVTIPFRAAPADTRRPLMEATAT